jgi:hypothetical protein
VFEGVSSNGKVSFVGPASPNQPETPTSVSQPELSSEINSYERLSFVAGLSIVQSS